MSFKSISKIELILEIKNVGKITCELKKHLSPKTVGTIVRSLPIDGNYHTLGNSIIYIQTTVNSGIERSRTEFKKGDIAFLPVNGGICFFTKDTISPKVMTPIGKITSNIDALSNLKTGDVLTLYADTG